MTNHIQNNIVARFDNLDIDYCIDNQVLIDQMAYLFDNDYNKLEFDLQNMRMSQ